MTVTPWHARLRRGAGLPSLLLILVVGIVASCASVTRSAGAPATPGIGSSASPSPSTSPPLTPAVVAAADPSVAPTGDGGAAASPSPSAEASPSPEAAVEVAPASETGTFSKPARRRLERIVRTIVRDKDLAGLQVAVRLPSGETWLGTAGRAEFDPQRPITDETVFSIASVTKTFVAALILQLAEEGRLDLDEPYGRYFKDGPRHRSVTVRQLLSHTSGIDEYFDNDRYLYRISSAWRRSVSAPGLLSREHRWTYDEIMGLVKAGHCRPGTCYGYSNTNYVILGRVAEAVGGAPIHEQLRERFFEPLGLQRTFYQPAEVPPADIAHGAWTSGSSSEDHTRDATVLPFMAAVSVADAAGAIASTARDLSVWADALYGGEVLSRGSLAQMTTMLEPGLYGLGTTVAGFDGHRALGHRGGLRGFEAAMWYLPGPGVSIALLSNEGNWYLKGVSTDVLVERLVKAVSGAR